jgi:DNA-directed RNA polymerase specialized sigma24 family protein
VGDPTARKLPRNLLSNRTLQCKAEDLASAALISLVKCQQQYWNQPYYVKRLIVNAIINEQKRQQKIFERELCAFAMEDGSDWFDTLPGRDGLAQSTQVKYDTQKMLDALHVLTEGERLVIQFYFGFNGIQPIKPRGIAIKLARTEFWVERRLASGLNRLRREMGNSPQKEIWQQATSQSYNHDRKSTSSSAPKECPAQKLSGPRNTLNLQHLGE